MPKWCFNVLTIAGPPEEVDRFVNAARDDTTDFAINNLIPMPEILDETAAFLTPGENVDRNDAAHASTGYSNWYDWRVDN